MYTILKRSFPIHLFIIENKFDWFFTRVIKNTRDLKDINNNVVHRVMVIIIFFFYMYTTICTTRIIT